VVSIRRLDCFADVRQSSAAPSGVAKATSIRRSGKFHSGERDRLVGSRLVLSANGALSFQPEGIAPGISSPLTQELKARINSGCVSRRDALSALRFDIPQILGRCPTLPMNAAPSALVKPQTVCAQSVMRVFFSTAEKSKHKQADEHGDTKPGKPVAGAGIKRSLARHV
jgi:hypothetical protein